MLLGIVLSCLVGFGLMGLMFFSRRQGYDAPADFGEMTTPGFGKQETRV
jgi:hypothetical protein